MGSSASNDYCAFTKAVEHLGDRWSLLIVRELFMFGPQGFSTLAAGLPREHQPVGAGRQDAQAGAAWPGRPRSVSVIETCAVPPGAGGRAAHPHPEVAVGLG